MNNKITEQMKAELLKHAEEIVNGTPTQINYPGKIKKTIQHNNEEYKKDNHTLSDEIKKELLKESLEIVNCEPVEINYHNNKKDV